MDTELRNTDRAVKRGDPGADALLISRRLRAGALAIEDVTLAARLGHQAAMAVVGEIEPLGNVNRGWQRSMMPLRDLSKRRPKLIARWLIEVGARCTSMGIRLETTPTRPGRDLADLMQWMRGSNDCGGMFCRASPLADTYYCAEHAKEILADVAWYRERLAAANPLLQVVGNPGKPDRIIADGPGKTTQVLDYKTASPAPRPLPGLLRPLSDSRYQFLRTTLDGRRGQDRLNETLWQRGRLAELLLSEERESS